MEKGQYQIEYEKFIIDYKIGAVSAEAVGELIARMAQYFAQYNMTSVIREDALNQKAVEIIQQPDENGKSLSVAKADLLIKATEEARASRIAKAHLMNIEQYINSAKALQKGLLNEYSHMGGI